VGEVGPGGVRQPGTVIKLAGAVACGRVGNLGAGPQNGARGGVTAGREGGDWKTSAFSRGL